MSDFEKLNEEQLREQNEKSKPEEFSEKNGPGFARKRSMNVERRLSTLFRFAIGKWLPFRFTKHLAPVLDERRREVCARWNQIELPSFRQQN